MNHTANWRQLGAEVFWGEIAPCEHLVQIYDEDSAFLDCLSGFVSGGLKADDAVIIIATRVHLQSLEFRLVAQGVNLVAASKDGRYFPFDAEATLSKFMVRGWPDEELFNEFVNSLLSLARGQNDRRVRAFGEMVAVLWAAGQNGATVRLEHLWHEFCRTAAFSLFCAYPRTGFTQNADASIRAICDAHTRVIAA